MKNQLSRLLSDPGSNPDEALQTYSDIKNIERTLDFAGYKDYGNKSFSPIGYEDIKNKLKDDEILLDFADFEPKGTTRQYVCYEIRNNQNYPKVHLICTGPQVEALLTEVREGNLSANSKGSENDILIGSRLKGIIGNASTVYYIPSGVFHNISIEGLSDGEKSLSDSFSFRRLSSSIDLYEE